MKNRTAKQYLALGDELGVEAAKVLVKAKHKWLEPAVYHGHSDPLGFVVKCQKCGHVKTLQEEVDGCPVPDPLDINDWNVAMEWFRKSGASETWDIMWPMFKLSKYGTRVSFAWWLMRKAQPKHYIIAACLAVEGAKE